MPNGAIVFGGSGANRTVTVTPTANTLGSATITVGVSDGASAVSDPFVLTVTGTALETRRFAYFNTTASTGNAADGANPEGDAWTNAEEYVLGTSPTAADPGTLLTAARDGANVILTFLASQAAGPGYNGLMRFYDVETTSDLPSAVSWTGLAGFTNIVGANQTITITRPLNPAPRFFLLKVRLQ